MWYLRGLRIYGNQHGTKILNATRTHNLPVFHPRITSSTRSRHKQSSRRSWKSIANLFELSMQKFTIHDLFMYCNQPRSEKPLRNMGVKQGHVRRTEQPSVGVSTWQGLELVGQQRVRINEGVVWVTGHDMAIIIMPSPETCFPVSNLLQNLLRYIGSESKSGLERKPHNTQIPG